MIPIEWLNELIQERDGYHRLLSDSGDLTLAAYELARAKLRSSERPSEVPTAIEVKAAARVIAAKVGGLSVPRTAGIYSSCERAGLAVL